MTGLVLLPAPEVVPGGVLAFVPIHDAGDAHMLGLELGLDLDPAELELALTMSPVRRVPFVAGRQALRAALRELDPRFAMSPLLRTSRGAPLIPDGATGSVSHKRTRAVALAARHGDPAHHAFVGVDLEVRPQASDAIREHERKRGLASRILTAREFDAIADLDAAAHREVTLLHFALKEAVYKTIDPWVGRYVRFTEVELAMSVAALQDGATSGVAVVTLRLPECDERQLHVDAAWSLEPEWIVATAISVSPKISPSVSPRAGRSLRPGSASRG